MTLSTGLALAASTAASCSSGNGDAAAPAPNITVERTGGFAGAKDTVDLAAHGSWTATNRNGDRRTGELTPEQTARVQALAADPRIPAEAGLSRPPTRCRDAYSYVLTVGTVRVAFVDCPADPEQPAASLVLSKQVLGFTIQSGH